MLYIELSCQVLTDGRFVSIGPDGFAIWVRSLLWCRKHRGGSRFRARIGGETRFVPAAVLPLLALGVRDTDPAVHALIEANLWKRTEGGYAVVDSEFWA